MITDFNRGSRRVKVYRDKWGKFWVKNNRKWTQNRLNAEEIVRYLSNLANNT